MKNVRVQWKAILIWAAIMCSLVGMYQGSLRAHARMGKSPLIYNDDSRQYVWLFLFDREGTGSPQDIQYLYRKAFVPVGVKLLYGAYAQLDDPRLLSKSLPYVLLFLLVAGVGFCAWRLGGPAASWAAMAFCLSSSIFLDRMTGGHARAFGYPFIALMLCFLAAGRPLGLAVCTMAGAAFYPIVSVMGGLSLAVWMVLPPRWRAEARGWSVRRRAWTVAGTACLTFLCVAPTLYGLKQYGPPMRAADAAAYPEYGPDGRYQTLNDRPPYTRLTTDIGQYAAIAVEGAGAAWHPAFKRIVSARRLPLRLLFWCLVLGGLYRLSKERQEALRCLILLGWLPVLHVVAKIFAPTLYLPQRYILYALPVLTVVLVPCALSALPSYFPRWKAKRWAGPAAILLICGFQLFVVGGRGSAAVGYHVQVHKASKIFLYFSGLRSDAMIAGWPGPSGIIDDVPYVVARSTFLTYENHDVLYKGYADQMRRRMRAFIDAYYATTPAPLVRLREEFGVTHLLFDREHYNTTPPWYFKPFDAWARAAYEDAKASGKGFEVGRQAGTSALAMRDKNLFVLDLGRLN